MRISERMGAWSVRHRVLAVGGWVAFVAVAVTAGLMVGQRMLSDNQSGSGESERAQQMLSSAGFPDRAGEQVLIQSRTLTVSDPRFKQAVGGVLHALREQPAVVQLRSPLTRAGHGQVSADGRSALVTFEVRGKSETADSRIAPVLDAVDRQARAHPGFFIGEEGDASANYQLNNTVGKDFQNAERLSIPVTLVILLFAFGALVAAGVPVVLAFTAVLATIGLQALVSHLVPSTSATQSVVLLIGMAVGVDYSLFYLQREREQRGLTKTSDRAAIKQAKRGVRAARKTRDAAQVQSARDALAAAKATSAQHRREALRVAAATSGRAVLVSGLTVMVAMAGMLLTGDKTFTSIGVGAMLVVFSTMIGSLTVLPAALALLGDRVDRGRIPLLHRLSGRAGGGVWGAVVSRVNRRPLLAAVVSASALAAMAIPALQLHVALPDFGSLPRSIPVVAAYDRVQQAFPGTPLPADVVVKAADVTDPAVRTQIHRLERRALASGQMSGPVHVLVNHDHTVAQVEIPLHGSGEDGRSLAALSELRGKLIPDTLGRLPGVETAVTGETAGSADFTAEMRHAAPLVFAFVLGLAFLLLLITFRSVVIPAQAIVLNLLSVGAAYGMLVLIFQHGIGGSLVGLHGTAPITSWLPLFLFVVLFGLSMDYHVFIVSRIRELAMGGMPTRDAVTAGISATAGTVTSAAAVMVGVFSIFATLSTIDLKQVGVGLAIAVLIDATIVRGVLLPSVMTLAGDWNWYMPRVFGGRSRVPAPQPDPQRA
jgi:RND superfamily putative drug exporter